MRKGKPMLSERGLAIIEKLIENNRKPITARALAISLGVSERSVKTYIKEQRRGWS